MWPFRRSRPKSDNRPRATIQSISDLMLVWLNRMDELLAARHTAAPSDIPAIDEKIDQLCQEAAEDVETTRGGDLSVRLQRMKQLTLDELCELRDKARQQRP